MATLPMPTVADLKAHMQYGTDDDGTDDDELRYFLTAALEVAESIVGPLAPRTVTETHYGVSSDLLVLREAPVVSLTSVSTLTPYLLADFTVDAETGIVRLAAGRRIYGDVTVTYVAGRSAIPYAVSLATLIIAAHLWETQRGSGPSAGPLQPDLAPAVPMGFAIPNRAVEMLATQRQVRVA